MERSNQKVVDIQSRAIEILCESLESMLQVMVDSDTIYQLSAESLMIRIDSIKDANKLISLQLDSDI